MIRGGEVGVGCLRGEAVRCGEVRWVRRGFGCLRGEAALGRRGFGCLRGKAAMGAAGIWVFERGGGVGCGFGAGRRGGCCGDGRDDRSFSWVAAMGE